MNTRKNNGIWRPVAENILRVEPLLLLAIGYFFWFPSNFPFFDQFGPAQPIDRAEWMWLLYLLLPVYAARYAVHRRLFSVTPLVPFMALFLALGLLNVQVSPFESRGVRMLARPLFGIALVVWMTERAHADGNAGVPLRIMVVMGLFWGFVALTTSQWNSKSDDFRFLIDALPRMDWFVFHAGFNANEIAGALAWLAPLAAGLVFYPWRRAADFWRGASLLAFILLIVALVLGQSRSAVAGTVGGLLVISLFALPPLRVSPWPRLVALSGIAGLVLLQSAVFFDLLSPAGDNESTASASSAPVTPAVSDRDERSFAIRIDIWESVAEILGDYPLTGVGMDRFRANEVRAAYPVPGFDVPYGGGLSDDFTRRILPHAHNELAQIGADFGLPGMLVFIAWYAATLWMVWVCWREGHGALRIAAVSTGAGLLAHLVYGMGDAITLWDRFAFVFWLMLGLVSAQWVVLRYGDDTGKAGV